METCGWQRVAPIDKRILEYMSGSCITLEWRHNESDGASNHQPQDCLLNGLFRCRSKKTSKLRDTGLCAGNSPVTGEFPAQRTSNAGNVSISWRHYDTENAVTTWLSHHDFRGRIWWWHQPLFKYAFNCKLVSYELRILHIRCVTKIGMGSCNLGSKGFNW